MLHVFALVSLFLVPSRPSIRLGELDPHSGQNTYNYCLVLLLNPW